MEVLIGHRDDKKSATGFTVFLWERPNQAVASVKGGAPGSRELPILSPGRLVEGVDAIVLSGGSAFGLAASEGVVTFLRERKRGFVTPAGPVPILPSAFWFVGRLPRLDGEETGHASPPTAPEPGAAP